VRVQLFAVTKTTSAPPAELSASADPELAVTLEWCAAMRAARKSRGLSQTELARSIRPATSQATISTIEKGVDETGRPVASDRILPICRVLEIAPPVVGQSPMMMRWIAVGRALEHRSPEILAAQLDSFERMVQAMAPAEAGPAPPSRTPRH
jgi:transcriptional regulator with XRE-family HTH domain